MGFSPDGKRIVSGSADHHLKVWDAQTGKELLTLTGHTDELNRVAFSPDGKHLVSNSDHELKVWDAQTGRELLIGHTFPVSSVAFSPDGKRIVSGSWDNSLRLWLQRGDPLLP